MKKKDFLKEVVSHVEAIGPENCSKQSITGHMVVAGATAAMCTRLLKNDFLTELGVSVEARGNNPALDALRDEINKREDWDFVDYNDMREYAEATSSVHKDFDTDRVVKEMRAIAKRNEIQLPRKSNLGKKKLAILDYFKEVELENTSIQGLADYLWDNTDVKDKDDAKTQASQMYSFSRKLIEIGFDYE